MKKISDQSAKKPSPAKKVMMPKGLGELVAVPEKIDNPESDYPPEDMYTLDSARTSWQFGDWDALIQIGKTDLTNHPDRAKLALLIAAAHAHNANKPFARHFASLAVSWGCSRRLVNDILISSLYNTLGRLSLLLNREEDASEYFNRAMEIIETKRNNTYLGRVRQISEAARLGLIPQASQLLDQEISSQGDTCSNSMAWRSVVEAQIEILHHELWLSLQKGQMFPHGDPQRADVPGQALITGDDLKRQSPSQLGQDLWVLEQTGYKRGGYFVEFGATDGIALSNTWLLEKQFGWKGICAEPNPEFYARLQVNRECKVSSDCIGGQTGEAIEFILAGVFGGMAQYANSDKHQDKRQAYQEQGKTLNLITISLHDFLKKYKAPKNIDYLSIDTEGSELEILENFPFEKWKIHLITVEHNFTPSREKIRKLLESKGYSGVESQWDDWYRLQA